MHSLIHAFSGDLSTSNPKFVNACIGLKIVCRGSQSFVVRQQSTKNSLGKLFASVGLGVGLGDSSSSMGKQKYTRMQNVSDAVLGDNSCETKKHIVIMVNGLFGFDGNWDVVSFYLASVFGRQKPSKPLQCLVMDCVQIIKGK